LPHRRPPRRADPSRLAADKKARGHDRRSAQPMGPAPARAQRPGHPSPRQMLGPSAADRIETKIHLNAANGPFPPMNLAKADRHRHLTADGRCGTPGARLPGIDRLAQLSPNHEKGAAGFVPASTTAVECRRKNAAPIFLLWLRRLLFEPNWSVNPHWSRTFGPSLPQASRHGGGQTIQNCR